MMHDPKISGRDGSRSSPETGIAAPAVPKIPDHELIRPIGRGSYGEVWLARNIMGSYRAVKVVYRRTFESERPYEREFAGIKRFEPISRSNASQLNILHMGRGDGYFFYVMELADDKVRGRDIQPDSYIPKTLREELTFRGRMPFQECLDIALTLTMALQHLHDNGLVHRDVKPSNIVFINGVPKLADIGLVAQADATLSCVGTEGFLPPEGPGSPQADLYSLGKVLYEISTGRDRQDYPELPTNLAEFPDAAELVELNEIVIRACQTDTRQRYATAAAMRADLELLRGGHSVTRLRQMERTLARLKSASIVVAVLTTLAMLAFFYQSHQTRAMKRLADDNSRLAQESKRAALASRNQTVRLQVAKGSHALEEENLTGALYAFAEAFTNLSGDPDAERVHRTRFASLLDNFPKLQHLFVHDGPVYLCAFSHDGRKLASLSTARSATPHDSLRPGATDATVQIFDLKTETRLLQIPLTNILVSPKSRPSLFFSEDDRRVVVRAAADEVATAVYDAFTGHRIDSGPHLAGRRLLDTTDGQTGLVADGDRAVELVELASGRNLSPRLRTAEKLLTGRLSQDSRRVMLVTVNSTPVEIFGRTLTNQLEVWELGPGRRLGAPGPVEADVQGVFSADGRRLFLTVPEKPEGGGRSVRVLDTETGSELTSEVKPGHEFDSFVNGPDGQWLITRHNRQTLLRNIDTGQLVTLDFVNPGGWHTYAFSPDRLLVSTDGDVWNLFDGQRVSPTRRHASWILGVAFSADGRHVATGSADRTVSIWNIAASPLPELAVRTHDPITDAAFSPDGTRIVTLNSWASSGRLWDAESGKPVGAGLLNSIRLSNVLFSPDGQHLAAYTGGRRKDRLMGAQRLFGCFLWPVRSHDKAVVLHTTAIVNCAAFSPDSQRLLTAGDDGLARVWDVHTGQELVTLTNKNSILTASFSPDGARILAAELRGAMRLWNSQTGQLLMEVTDREIGFETVVFSPEGQRIAVGGGDQCARVWNLRSHSFVTAPLFHGGNPNDLRFSPDGRLLLTFGLSSMLKIWDVEASDLAVAPLPHGNESIVTAEFSPDGRSIVSSSGDGTARVWDTATGQLRCVPLKHRGGVYAAKFNGAGDRILTAGQDSTVKVWRLNQCQYSPEEISRIAELFSCTRLDGTSTERRLKTPEITERYVQLRNAHPELFRADPQAEAAWHEQLAHLAKDAKNWAAVIWHLDDAFQSDPLLAGSATADELFNSRGHAKAELGQWPGAVADFERAAQIDGDKINNWSELCRALLGSGQNGRYGSSYAAMLGHFGSAAKAPTFAGWTISWVLTDIGTLAPNPIPPEQILQAAASLRAAQPSGTTVLMHGRALYRAGRFAQAVDELLSGIEMMKAQDPDYSDWDDLLFLSMAQCQAGQNELARRTYKNALASWEIFLQETPGWICRAPYHSLNREAETVLVHHGGNSSVGRIIGVIGLSLKRLFLPVSMKKAADLRFWHNPAGNKRESRGEIQIAAISLLSASVGSKSDDVNQVVKPCRALPW
ncbi:MAG: protein kinase [Verrucomicrobiia bacterium]